ncbi:dTDP-4-amino-4,6-dideoxygalactose transaminase [Variovorax sp. VRV01]|uniref:dTDP-4-amino-4,6-dideoxygalactose transaminase n=1 Tax=Variovorax sp. VRV01 TaxID=2769259 RepID=UPI00177FE802|nr:dTDP-4-amino-4,6-dideoxygalactose transaminase [Variovorax sp. VRV01]MBD9663189.1 dTDP-4-amino-4,6-dideoxygalactose transaminase [Variovorax sp. VRV01]
MIPFNRPPRTGNEDQYVLDAMRSNKISGDGQYGQKCQAWFESHLDCPKTLLTPSCTQALEMAALLIDIQLGDEVIMPSYTFVSTANAFVLRGAKIVFVDIHPDTMNMDASLIEAAITPRTKAIVPVHYAGVGCDMKAINSIAQRHNLFVIEDAAQGMMARYEDRYLGTLGHIAAFSFHETKNVTSGGEGGLLILNDPRFIPRAEIIREKGTNRNLFFRGMVDKYTWVDAGSSYLPSELQAAYLWGQLAQAEAITRDRLITWDIYYKGLAELAAQGCVTLPNIPPECQHNAHMFYLKCKSLEERAALLAHFKKQDILAVFHYVPLHSAPAGERFSRFHGVDRYTTQESERLIRLPLWYGMERNISGMVIEQIKRFYLDRR